MSEINKTTQFNQQLSITSEDGVASNYASFSGSIDKDGIPSVNYYISDASLYHGHLSEFRDGWSKFQTVVFEEADKVTQDEH